MKHLVYFFIFCLLTACANTLTEEGGMFVRIPSNESGITFKNNLVEKFDNNILRSEYFYNGGGVSAGDINNDGLVDLYFVSNQGKNRLYLNLGDFKFKDITDQAFVGGHEGWASGSSMVDINNDGYLDIYVCYTSTAKLTQTQNQFFINNGDLTFKESAIVFGLHDRAQSNQAAFLDYDKDGDLDVFLTNHLGGYPQIKDTLELISKPSLKAGDKLYRNDDMHFVDVTKESGINNHALGFSLGLGIGDVNNDGWPDIYVGNDFIEKDYLYINNQNGTFSESSKDAFGHISYFSMGNDIADINNDGLLDIVSLDMANVSNYDAKVNMSGMNPEGFNNAVKKGFHYQYMYNTLQMNMGNGKFSELAQLYGIAATEWSWSPLVADFDNDGYKDIFITNGFRRNFRNKDFQKYQEKKYKSQQWTKATIPYLMKDLLEHLPVMMVPNYMFVNQGGTHFNNKSTNWGLEEPSFSNGAAYADLDNDGDLDLVVNNIDQEAFLYENRLSTSNFFKIKFHGSKTNRDGIGAKVTLFQADTVLQYAENYMVRGYRSSVPTGLHFGLGDIAKVDKIQVEWFDGKTETVQNVSTNQNLTFDYSKARIPQDDTNRSQDKTLFYSTASDSLGLDFVHSENEFDDYSKQVLLPHKYSQFGPALSKGDVNNDGLEDIYVGGASGQSGTLFIQQGTGGFIEKEGPWSNHYEKEDIAAVFFDADADGDQDLYIASGGYEWSRGDEMLKDRLYLNDGKGVFSNGSDKLPQNNLSTAVVNPCDFDNDGDLDLFIGERIIPQQYPKAASGYLYHNDNGSFKDVTESSAPELKNIGLITDATWLDVDGDSDPDLVVVGEWMPVTIFINQEGKLIKSNIGGLENSTGWWYAIAGDDFDNDGDIDLVAGNLGLNYKYKASEQAPFELYSADFDQNNSLDIVLSFSENDKHYPLRGRECSSEQLPFIKERFPDYKSFASATLEEVLGEADLKAAQHLIAQTFASTYFENMGDRSFRQKRLPMLAQLSSVNDVEIWDYNKDGNLDMVLTGNMYQSEVETPRNDASYGTVLLGNGKGDFKALYPYESGLYAGGDVKNCIRIKGKADDYLIIARNDDVLQAFKLKR